MTINTEEPAVYQVKSRWYYVFWGICAAAVVSGQIYVGSGYRRMAAAGEFQTELETLVLCSESRLCVESFKRKVGEPPRVSSGSTLVSEGQMR